MAIMRSAGALLAASLILAKLGELVLRKGMWNGRHIVSEEWIEKSTRARPDGWPLYGYLWWVAEETIIGGRAMSWIFGQGFGSQRIYIVPAYDLVVVIMAGRYEFDPQERVDLFGNYVLAAMRE
jgi:CubicO group peptidase (beta-lactamase class C family)